MHAWTAGKQERYPWMAAERRDAEQRPPGHPQYDPTTLHVPPAAKKKMTHFEQ